MPPSILDQFDLKDAQLDAAAHLDTHLAVTAGAGSGKTRALVARYLNFVEHGVPLRSLVAITFTEKAAREMRSRIRREIEKRLNSLPLPGTTPGGGRAGDGGGEGVWQQAFADLDSARIGTIHSLCADLLHLHPAEAGVDPRFTVLEEGLAATLRAQAVESALAWAASDPEAAQLFAFFKERELETILHSLISRRLDAANLLSTDPLEKWERELKRWFAETLDAPNWSDALATLADHRALSPDDKLELARRAVLAHWNNLQAARDAADWDAALAALHTLRGATSTAGQKAGWDAASLDAVRGAMRIINDHYDENIKPILKDNPHWEFDRRTAALLPALRRLFERALADYTALKADRLDFDDLEDLTVRLLDPLPLSGVVPHRGRVGDGGGMGVLALLVDEFQDTNDRQRRIVYALCNFNSPPLSSAVLDGGGARGGGASHPLLERSSPTGEGSGEGANLFIVGDAKQSIYRFRNADVTVFRNIQRDIARRGGQTLELDLTFRAHQPLLDLIARLLTPLMGEADDPARPYRVPFAPLTAYRQQPRQTTRAPFLEFHLGAGDANSGRRAAAAALAARLHELHSREEFKWGDIALLFRASTAFPVYEDALEAAGIPFVTVAGKGFYDRPEIRDLLNVLAALADPADDLALAGLLRSPAFALTDADLYHLRFPNGGETPHSLYQSLLTNLQFSSIAQTLTRLHSLSGRLPVAELLKRFLDLTHYRALLSSANGTSRLARNVDKLLADAHRSHLVSVGDFLEYVGTLRDVGAREGEAPAEAGDSVQLMTVHKAKGLEFPLVVIADAAYAHLGGGGNVQLDPELGVLLKLNTGDSRPMMWQLGAQADADREDAEDLRLLYVAATRAKEKIVVSGHAKISAAKDDPGRLLLTGWLKRLGKVVGLDAARVDSIESARALSLSADWADSATATLYPLPQPARQDSIPLVAGQDSISSSAIKPGPLATLTFSPPPSVQSPEDEGPEADPPPRVWRIAAQTQTPPAWVVGKIVHEALRRWLFPDAPNFEARLRPTAVAAGLADEPTIRAALREARRLLERFRTHPLFAEMDAASERYHEVPYVLGSDAGIIDVLYRSASGWAIADFKTDSAQDEAEARGLIEEKKYDAQLNRYGQAVAAQLREPPRTLLVMLNVGGEVRVMPPE